MINKNVKMLAKKSEIATFKWMGLSKQQWTTNDAVANAKTKNTG